MHWENALAGPRSRGVGPPAAQTKRGGPSSAQWHENARSADGLHPRRIPGEEVNDDGKAVSRRDRVRGAVP